ncbi:MAG: diguanylate cyclase [Lachnospiraceae bacterium]|nr:diguanylate cyclase [Lachnospiraceae bacterium]
MKNESLSSDIFESFLQDNRITINTFMNKILWFCILTGPAIALGIYSHIFPEASYITCMVISGVVLFLAIMHTLFLRLWPASYYTSLFVLSGLNILLVYMSYAHIYIHVTWFLIPLISLLFCDKKIYFATVLFNYIMMHVATWISGEYVIATSAFYPSPRDYYLNEIGGLTIESTIMAVAGYYLGKRLITYLKMLLEDKITISASENRLTKQVKLLDSMSEIYDYVNLIDFEKETELSLRDSQKIEYPLHLTNCSHTRMANKIAQNVAANQVEEFLLFSDLTTIQTRLFNKKIIAGEYLNIHRGWFRTQYITIEADSNGFPKTIVVTTQNIDEEKRREQHLLKIALTDELTQLYNRRHYDEDIAELESKQLPDNIAILSVDVNGLKPTNDTAGHAAGDELIKGAADCLLAAVRGYGKIYRTGGDEFMAILTTDDPQIICSKIRNLTNGWQGIYVKELSLSLGFASHKDYPEASIRDLEKIADSLMYQDKEQYYRKRGIAHRQTL